MRLRCGDARHVCCPAVSLFAISHPFYMNKHLMNKHLHSRIAAALGGLAVIAACSGDTSAPTSLTRVSSIAAETEHPGGEINVCKFGGPAGNYTFQIGISGGGNYLLKYGSQPTL